MSASLNGRASCASLLISTLMLSACGTTSPVTPSDLPQPRIPSPPRVDEPKPSGAYLTRHCDLVAKVRSTLNSSQPTSAPCAQLGR